MANVDLVDLIPILKAVYSIKNEYKATLDTEEDDFALYPVLTENFLDSCYNNGYEVGFKQCLSEYLATYDEVEDAITPRPMRELVPMNYTSFSGNTAYDVLTDVMNFCLHVRQNLKTILDLDTDLFELYPPALVERGAEQYTAGFNDGYINALNYLSDMIVPAPIISCANNLISFSTTLADSPAVKIFYKLGSLSGDWIEYQAGDYIPISEDTRVYAYTELGTKTSDISSVLCVYNSFLSPTINFNNNTITIVSNFTGGDVKTKYKLSSWESYNDYLDYDGLPIPVTSTTTVWAYNYLGEQTSNVVSMVCTPTESVVTRPAVPSISFSSQNNVLSITCSTTGASIYYKKQGTSYWIPYTGAVTLVESGTYTAISSLNGVESLESSPVVCTVSTSGGGITPTGTVVIAPRVICNNNTVSVFTPQTGVTLSIIRTNGEADPATGMTNGSTYTYSGPITISKTGTFQAKATLNSDSTKFAWSVPVECVYSSVTPGSGSVPGGGEGSSTEEYVAAPLMKCSDSILTINPVTAGSTIYYREKGSDVWIEYSSPVSILTDWTYEAYAAKYGYSSSIAELFCTTQIPVAPTIECTADGRVTMTTPSDGATIKYKKSSDTDWNTYMGSFNIYEDTTFQAKSIRNGYESSVTEKLCEVESTLLTISFNQNVISISTLVSPYDIIQYKKSTDSEWTTYTQPFSFNETATYDARVMYYGSQVAITTKECLYIKPVSLSFDNNTNYLTLTTSETGGTIKYKKSTDSTWSTYSSMILVSDAATYQAKTVKGTYESNITALNCIPSTQIDYANEYFTIEFTELVEENITMSIAKNSNNYAPEVYYKVGNNAWTLLGDNTEFNVGDVVKLKNTVGINGTGNGWDLNTITVSGAKFIAYGNILSLLHGDNFTTRTFSDPGISPAVDMNIYGTWGTQSFKRLFAEQSIVSAENLILPSVVSDSCYLQMFMDCTDLVEIPSLSATTMYYSCYESMFYGCTSLTSAPSLIATTLAERCYFSMFMNCTGITTAHSIYGTTAPKRCCQYMFSGCTSLTTAPTLPATTLGDGCYAGMFYGCTSLTTAPTLPATTLVPSCYDDMFNSCISLTVAPDLPATTLATDCYDDMFFGCTSLNYIKCLATSNINNNTSTWVFWVSETGTFVKKSGATWQTGTSGIPTGWTVQEV